MSEPELHTVSGRSGQLHPSIELEVHDLHLGDVATAYWLVRKDDPTRWAFTAAEVAELGQWRAHETAARVRAAATATDTTSTCPSCGQGVVVTSRSDLTGSRRFGSYPCKDCRKRVADEQAAARRREAELAALQRQQLADDAAVTFALLDVDPPALSEVTLDDAVALLALLRRGDNDLVRTLPLREWDEPYSADSDRGADRVRTLWRGQLLRVHPGTALEAFGYTEDGEVGIHVDQTSFVVTGRGPTGPRNAAALKELHALIGGPWPDRWVQRAPAVAEDLLLQEGLAYLDLLMNEHSFNFTAGDRTKLAVGRALEHFSLGGVYGFLWRAVTQAAAYYQRSNIPKQQAANSVVSRIDGSVDRYLAESWETKVYRRDWRLPVPVLTSTFFTSGLGIGDVMSAEPASVAQAIADKNVAPEGEPRTCR